VARPDHLLAVDGGNTTTVAVVADTSGTIRGAARGGCSDMYATATVDEALTELLGTARAAMAAAGIAPNDLAAAAYSLAGADWPEDFALLEKELGDAIDAARPPIVVNDAIGALWTGIGAENGAVSACGTYSAFAARGPSGTWHASFWSEPTGAAYLGTGALRAICRAHLGSGPRTGLTERILQACGVESEEALLHRYTSRSRPARAELGRLAPSVLDVADEGDPVARALVDDVADAIMRSVHAAAARTGLAGRYPVALAGGLFRHRSRLLYHAVATRLPDTELRLTPTEPVAGALLLAAAEASVSLDRLAVTTAVDRELPIPPRQELRPSLAPTDALV
jgi:N-acetylglucosamine kinase-like BadF-type ATPase